MFPEQVLRVEQELIQMYKTLNETKEELKYYKALDSSSKLEVGKMSSNVLRWS
jgi:hypothetical protein